MSDCNGLSDGSCNLSDGSSSGEWRLPNRRELFSLIHDGYFEPSVSDTTGTGQWSEEDPFYNLQNGGYWSSTTYASDTSFAWNVSMDFGVVLYSSKSFSTFVWPVRGGH